MKYRTTRALLFHNLAEEGTYIEMPTGTVLVALNVVGARYGRPFMSPEFVDSKERWAVVEWEGKERRLRIGDQVRAVNQISRRRAVKSPLPARSESAIGEETDTKPAGESDVGGGAKPRRKGARGGRRRVTD